MASSKSFCVLPWIHLATHPQGDVSLCCASEFKDRINTPYNILKNGEKNYLKLKKNNLSEIINSDSFRQIRREMLKGEMPLACKRCYQEERAGIDSKRIEENRTYKSFKYSKAKKLTNIDGTIDLNLRFIELRLGNACNLKCRTCNPFSSSKWVSEYTQLSKDLDFALPFPEAKLFDWPESPEFWQEIWNASHSLETLYINGGEPLMNKSHWKLLEKLASSGRSKKIKLWYNTNLTMINEKDFDLWKAFKSVRFDCSIDCLGARNDYIRSGSHWDDLIEKLKLLKKTPFDVKICQTISWLNVYYLDEFREYMRELDLVVHFNPVHDPKYLSPWILPDKLKHSIFERVNPSLPRYEQKHLRSILFDRSQDMDQLQKGLVFNDWLDKSRKESFAEIFPELEKELSDSM